MLIGMGATFGGVPVTCSAVAGPGVVDGTGIGLAEGAGLAAGDSVGSSFSQTWPATKIARAEKNKVRVHIVLLRELPGMLYIVRSWQTEIWTALECWGVSFGVLLWSVDSGEYGEFS